MHRLDDDLDTELLELDFQQPRHRLQRFGGILLLLLLSHVQQGKRRQAALDQRIDEEVRLLFFHHALALFHRLGRCRRRNHRRHAFLALAHVLVQRLLALQQPLFHSDTLPTIRQRARHLVDHVVRFAKLGHQLLAFGASVPPATEETLDQLEQVKRDLAGQVHHLEPGQVGKDGQAEQEERQQQQGAALHVERRFGQLPQAFTQRSARRCRQVIGELEMDIGQRGAGQDQEHQADQPPGKQPAVPCPGLVPRAKHLPGLDAQ